MKISSSASSHRKLGELISAGIRWIRAISLIDAVVLIGALGLALGLRISLLDFKSLDFYASLKPWYNTIEDGGYSAFATDFSTYNPPYLYLLYLIARFIPDLPVVVAVKLPSLVSDFLCAYLVFLIVGRLSASRAAVAIVAGMSVLFAPTVVLNSAFWGQADSIFMAGILACVYFLLLRRSDLAMLAFAIALAFKLQAVFLSPVLLAMFLRGNIRRRSLLLIPLVLFLAIVPAWAAGRPFGELFNVYGYQTSQFEFITMNAPSAYAWMPDTKRVFNLMYVPGVLMGAGAAFMWFLLLHKSRRGLDGRLLVEAALISVLVVPLFLPKMHERYFYPADILSISLAFLYPELFYIPFLVVGASFLAYQPFLFERQVLPLPVLTLVLMLAVSLLSYHALRQLYGSPKAEEAARDQIPPNGSDDDVMAGAL